MLKKAKKLLTRPAGGMGALEAPHWGPGAKPREKSAFLMNGSLRFSLNFKLKMGESVVRLRLVMTCSKIRKTLTGRCKCRFFLEGGNTWLLQEERNRNRS